MKSAARSQPSQQAPESLRERKKRLTREAIFAAARALFSERGFDDVTVAEIADAANISVKTLFTYIGSKEELLFSGRPTVLDAVVEAVRNRRLAPDTARRRRPGAARGGRRRRPGQEPRRLPAHGRQRPRRPVPAARPVGRDRGRPHRGPGHAEGRSPRTGRAAADRRPDHGPRPHGHQRRGRRPHRQVSGHASRRGRKRSRTGSATRPATWPEASRRPRTADFRLQPS